MENKLQTGISCAFGGELSAENSRHLFQPVRWVANPPYTDGMIAHSHIRNYLPCST